MEKQISAVEWLEKEAKRMQYQCSNEWQCGYQKALNDVLYMLTKAKEMEKEQITEAVKYGNSFEQGDLRYEVYYNKTFKSE